jgi:hypothetical protein
MGPEGEVAEVEPSPEEVAVVAEGTGVSPLGFSVAEVSGCTGVETLVKVSVTGQMVVEIATVEVTMAVSPSPAGQSVTVGAQLVTVETMVEYTVEVVM